MKTPPPPPKPHHPPPSPNPTHHPPPSLPLHSPTSNHPHPSSSSSSSTFQPWLTPSLVLQSEARDHGRIIKSIQIDRVGGLKNIYHVLMLLITKTAWKPSPGRLLGTSSSHLMLVHQTAARLNIETETFMLSAEFLLGFHKNKHLDGHTADCNGTKLQGEKLLVQVMQQKTSQAKSV